MDAIKLYLKDIRTLPLLSAENERKVAKKVKRGDKNARHEMIRSNLRLVINIAKKYSYLGVPMLDLIEEGNLGLMKAVNKFDPDRGYRFSTYAAWWIKQYITRAVANQGKTVRIPVYVMEMLMRFQKIKKQLSQSLKKSPQINEIASKMKLPIVRVKQLSRMASNVASLNAPIGEAGGSEFMDLIEDDSVGNAADELSKFLLKERVEGLLENMTPREKKILTLRFGLEEGSSHTLRDTAKYFGITRERVRQIEAACMIKLRKMMEDQEKTAEQKMKNSKVPKEKTKKIKTVRVIKMVAGKGTGKKEKGKSVKGKVSGKKRASVKKKSPVKKVKINEKPVKKKIPAKKVKKQTSKKETAAKTKAKPAKKKPAAKKVNKKKPSAKKKK